jgi:sulfatase maturation enzyme AslB (radical SAM superfamily)
MQRLRRAVEITQAAAGAAGLEWGGYLATNGTFDPREAVWLGQQFDRISVSCDGPADVQDELRPLHSNRPSASLVERGMQALCEAGAGLTVRATITSRNLRRQAELVRFFHARWSVNRIRLEPVYLAAGNPTGLTDDDAETFVQHFLEAEETGRACGCDVSTSCVRLDELHGPYCDFLRGTVVLCADGRVRHCAFRAKAEGMAPDWPGGGLLWRQDLLLEARRRTLRTPSACIDCLNRYHCSRNCPDICYYDEEPESPGGGFRCRVARALTTGWLQSAVASIQAEQTQRAMLCDNPSLGD